MVAPLDWGLGHVTRCIPIIRALIYNGFEVVLAAENAQANLLKNEFPLLLLLPLKGYRVTYSKYKWWLPVALFLQLPRVLVLIRQENRWLNGIIAEHGIDLVISDNRFGLYSGKIPCIFITHQLTIKAPFVWVQNLIRKINYSFINRFTSCWVPDAIGKNNLAGLLSHPTHLPKTKLHYIGLLSRFVEVSAENKYDFCILLSGPEPQRTLLEEKILTGLALVPGKILLVRGMPGNTESLSVPKNTTVQNHLSGNLLQEAILQSSYIISRSGYTTLMEILSLYKKSILIPTPGQTEQEYLAKKLQKQNACLVFTQAELNCATHFKRAKDFQFQLPEFAIFKEETIIDLLKKSI